MRPAVWLSRLLVVAPAILVLALLVLTMHGGAALVRRRDHSGSVEAGWTKIGTLPNASTIGERDDERGVRDLDPSELSRVFWRGRVMVVTWTKPEAVYAFPPLALETRKGEVRIHDRSAAHARSLPIKLTYDDLANATELSLHADNENYALVGWSTGAMGDGSAYRAISRTWHFTRIPAGFSLRRPSSFAWGSLLFAVATLALALVMKRNATALVGESELATWSEGLVKGGLLSTKSGAATMLVTGVAEGPVVYCTKDGSSAGPYRSSALVHRVIPGTRDSVATAHRAVVITGLASLGLFAAALALAVAISAGST